MTLLGKYNFVYYMLFFNGKLDIFKSVQSVEEKELSHIPFG